MPAGSISQPDRTVTMQLKWTEGCNRNDVFISEGEGGCRPEAAWAGSWETGVVGLEGGKSRGPGWGAGLTRQGTRHRDRSRRKCRELETDLRKGKQATARKQDKCKA